MSTIVCEEAASAQSLCEPRRGLLGEAAGEGVSIPLPLVTVLDICLPSSEVKCGATPWLMREAEMQAGDSETLGSIAGCLTPVQEARCFLLIEIFNNPGLEVAAVEHHLFSTAGLTGQH